MLALDLSSDNLGIGALAVHLPRRTIAPAECLRESPAQLSIEQVRNVWRDTIIEPEYIFRFFTGQMPSVTDFDGRAERFTCESGINVVHISDQSSSDMAIDAAKNLFGQSGVARSAGAIIYYSSTLGAQPVCSIPCRLQHELGLTNATALGVAQKGANVSFIALKIAAEMSLAEDMKAALLIGSECYIPPYQRSLGNIALYGDSSTGIIVSRSTYDLRLLYLSIMDHCILFSADRPHNADFADLIAEKTALTVWESLKAAGVTAESISVVLPPNWNLKALRQISEKTGVSWQKFYTNALQENGCLGSSDLVVNLHHALRNERFHRGDLILAIGISAECSVACGLFLHEPGANS
jgi:3-oxoacyl-[acyl-carrier-protein] synthase-3